MHTHSDIYLKHFFSLSRQDKNLCSQRAEGDVAHLQAHQAFEREGPHQSSHAPAKTAAGHPSVSRSHPDTPLNFVMGLWVNLYCTVQRTPSS